MYSYETKLAAVRDVIDRGMRLTQVMAKYGIASQSPVSRWCGSYRTGGAETLRAKRQGRPKGSWDTPQPRCSPEQALRDQARYLQAKDRSRTGRKPE
jgi:transposase